MRVLFISKRRPQGRDLATRPYGRYIHLPLEMRRLGHDVRVVCVGLRNSPDVATSHRGLPIQAVNVLPSPWRCIRKLQLLCSEWQPEWIVGGSDIYPGLLATYLAQRVGAKIALDAYDNFEAYAPWAIPAHWLWHRALARCQLASAAGPQLLERMAAHAQSAHRVVVPMAADPEFAPSSKLQARQALNLPTNARLFGYIGSLDAKRGGQILCEAWERVAKVDPTARLVLCGRKIDTERPLPGVLHLGYIPDGQMPAIQQALDSAIVLGSDTAFSRFSYPSKLCEALACGTPVVASATDPIRWMVQNTSVHLVPINDSAELADVLRRLSPAPDLKKSQARTTWMESARTLSKAMEEISA